MRYPESPPVAWQCMHWRGVHDGGTFPKNGAVLAVAGKWYRPGIVPRDSRQSGTCIRFHADMPTWNFIGIYLSIPQEHG